MNKKKIVLTSPTNFRNPFIFSLSSCLTSNHTQFSKFPETLLINEVLNVNVLTVYLRIFQIIPTLYPSDMTILKKKNNKTKKQKKETRNIRRVGSKKEKFLQI